MSKDTTTRYPVETVVGTRMLRPGQPWWKGEGRGFTREFLDHEAEAETKPCQHCGEELPLDRFPTFTVPRKDGRTRGDVCRDCVQLLRTERKAKAKRREAARKAAATRAARKARKEGASAAA